jgi:hypothetical protein
MFKLALTFPNPGQPQNAARGFPQAGYGAQTIGDGSQAPAQANWNAEKPTKGFRSWLRPADGSNAQRGMPEGQANDQRYPPGLLENQPPFGGVEYVYTPYYDRGAAAYAPNFGYVLSNPIGAGRVALDKPQASYGKAGQYEHGMIFWTSQVIPTSVNLTGLETAEGLAQFADALTVDAMVRVG